MNFQSGVMLLALVSFTSLVYSVNELATVEAELHGHVSPHYNAMAYSISLTTDWVGEVCSIKWHSIYIYIV